MTGEKPHRGISYSVRRMGAQRWQWRIEPPECIRGLYSETGEVEGPRADAVAAAQKAIDIQTQQFAH